VSLFDPARLATLLHMPEGATPMAVLCLGYVEAFYPRPMLETERWAERIALDTLVFQNRWEA
jgi:5,6-dimethylbenzimidazole synthase